MQGALKRLNDGIASYESMLTTPLESKAGLGSVNGEIRDHVKKLSASDRETFISDALEHKDVKTLLAICGGEFYLSGLTRERHALLVRQYHLMTNGEVEARLSLMRAARTHIERSGPLIFTQLEAAVGWKRRKWEQARERQKVVDKALSWEDPTA